MERGKRINKFISHLEKLVNEANTSSLEEVNIPQDISAEYCEGLQECLIIALECFSKIRFSKEDPNVQDYVLWLGQVLIKIRKLGITQGDN